METAFGLDAEIERLKKERPEEFERADHDLRAAYYRQHGELVPVSVVVKQILDCPGCQTELGIITVSFDVPSKETGEFYDGMRMRERHPAEKRPYNTTVVVAQFVFMILAVCVLAVYGAISNRVTTGKWRNQ